MTFQTSALRPQSLSSIKSNLCMRGARSNLPVVFINFATKIESPARLGCKRLSRNFSSWLIIFDNVKKGEIKLEISHCRWGVMLTDLWMSLGRVFFVEWIFSFFLVLSLWQQKFTANKTACFLVLLHSLSLYVRGKQ